MCDGKEEERNNRKQNLGTNSFQTRIPEKLKVGDVCITHESEERKDQKTGTPAEDGVCLAAVDAEVSEEIATLALHHLMEGKERGRESEKKELGEKENKGSTNCKHFI